MTLNRWIPVLLLSGVLVSGCIEAASTGSEKITFKDLTFSTNLTASLAKANESGEPLFVYFRSDTCGWCKKFEEESFTNESIVGILSNNFTLTSIDVYKQKNTTRFYGVRGTPHELFLYANGTEIKRLPGYVDNQTFLNTINEITSITGEQKNET